MRKSITAVAALLLLSACSAQPAQSEPASEPSAASQPTQEVVSSAPPKAASEVPPTNLELSPYDECVLEAAGLAGEFHGVDPSEMLDSEEVRAACDENGPVEQSAAPESPANLDALYAECIESNATMVADMNGGTVDEWRDHPDVVAICEGQVAFEEATQ